MPLESDLDMTPNANDREYIHAVQLDGLSLEVYDAGESYGWELVTACGRVQQARNGFESDASALQDGLNAALPLKTQPAAPLIDAATLNAICWINQTTFPGDLMEELTQIGTPPDLAREISVAMLTMGKKGTFTQLYHDYAYSGDCVEWQGALSAYATAQAAKLAEIQARLSGADAPARG